jgi:hypothetical protein
MKQSAPSLAVWNNTFANNTGYAITVLSAVPAARLDLAGNQGSGNGVNGILLDVTLDTMTMKPNPTLPYVIQTITVASGKEVTVEPGVVFKGDQVQSGGGSLLAVYGTLRVDGRAGEPASFTSLQDDSIGGDTNADAGASLPAAGDWRGIDVGQGGLVNLTHATLRYAGSDNVGLFNNGGQVSVDHSTIEHNVGCGLGIMAGGTLTLTHSVINDNSGAGVGISADSMAMIAYNDFSGNGQYGVRSSTPPTVFIPAEYNYWGSADGPSWDGNYCANAPTGSGDRVTCHNVDYEPFATTPYN